MNANVTADLGAEKYRTVLKAGSNTFLADEPEDKGGSNQGPAPGDLLAGALAACTAITLKMFAENKQWPLENVHVEIKFDQEQGYESTVMERKITLSGDLTDEQKERLLSVANKCPVHKTLTQSIFVNTTLQ
eukprot:gene10781-13692_t